MEKALKAAEAAEVGGTKSEGDRAGSHERTCLAQGVTLVECSDWFIIPAENLVALSFRAPEGASVFGVASSAPAARLMLEARARQCDACICSSAACVLPIVRPAATRATSQLWSGLRGGSWGWVLLGATYQALETGLDGVLLCTDSPDEASCPPSAPLFSFLSFLIPPPACPPPHLDSPYRVVVSSLLLAPAANKAAPAVPDTVAGLMRLFSSPEALPMARRLRRSVIFWPRGALSHRCDCAPRR